MQKAKGKMKMEDDQASSGTLLDAARSRGTRDLHSI